MKLILVSSGGVLDTLTLDGDTITYSTGRAQSIVDSFARARNLSQAQAYQQLNGWSHGYLQFRSEQ